jgi:hypothetical protein
MFYSFKKWFFDINIGDETYIYFLIAEIRFSFFKLQNFTFHCFNHHSESLTKTIPIHLTNQEKDWEILYINSRNFSVVPRNHDLNITADFKDLNIRLIIRNCMSGLPKNALIINHKNKKIEWSPVTGFLTASGTIKIGDNVIQVEKVSAYIDHVFTDILPFNLPVIKMYWGRVLHSEIRISFSIVFSAKGEQWSGCYVMIKDQLFSLTEIQYRKNKGLSDEQEANGYQLTAMEGLNRLTMKIDHLKVAAAGAFIEPDKYKNKDLYRLLNIISKNPRGKKYISGAEVMLEINGQLYQWRNLICIDEYVLF